MLHEEHSDRSDLRKHFQSLEQKKEQRRQFDQQTASIEDLRTTIIGAFELLVKYLDGKTTKTEVTNQLKSISTPDVEKVVTEIAKLDKTVLANKLDLKPLKDALEGIHTEIKKVPKELPKLPEQKGSTKISNLSEIKLDTSELLKAIKALKLDVKAPIINTEKVDLKPVQDILSNLLVAINKQKFEIPDKTKIDNFDEMPLTDLTKLEKEAEKGTKLLKKIVDKPVGGGGGGGSSSLEFPLYATITSTTVTVGAVQTIIETDTKITLTTVINRTDPDNIAITETWS